MKFMSSFGNALLISMAVLPALVSATQIMRRPDTYMNYPHVSNSSDGYQTQVIQKRSTGKVQAAYYPNWDIYGENFQPTQIDPTHLTHILYAFADVSPDTGVISLTDSYADEQKHFPTDSWSDTGNNLYGCLKQLYLLKLSHRNLKVLLSIGGWTYSQNGHFAFVTSASSRATFVSNAVRLVEDYGLDGIDIDFEYPSNTAQGQGFADLTTALRTAFDILAAQKGDNVPYQISVAVSAGAANYAHLVIPQMDAAVTLWNLMAYDYAGSWLNWTDNAANLYGSGRTDVCTDVAVKHFTSRGATASKIAMGIPMYGHAFESTVGLGSPYNGIGPGTVQPGIYSYKVLPLTGATVYENITDVTSYSYNPSSREFVSYDIPSVVAIKAQYVVSNGLAGSMFWELGTDKVGPDSLVGTSAQVYGGLDQTRNHISYPHSKWDNIKDNMGSSTPPLPTSITSPTPTASPSPTTTNKPGGSCSGVVPWKSNIVYASGQLVTYDGFVWTAKWWTKGDIPGSKAGVWVKGSAC